MAMVGLFISMMNNYNEVRKFFTNGLRERRKLCKKNFKPS